MSVKIIGVIVLCNLPCFDNKNDHIQPTRERETSIIRVIIRHIQHLLSTVNVAFLQLVGSIWHSLDHHQSPRKVQSNTGKASACCWLVVEYNYGCSKVVVFVDSDVVLHEPWRGLGYPWLVSDVCISDMWWYDCHNSFHANVNWVDDHVHPMMGLLVAQDSIVSLLVIHHPPISRLTYMTITASD